MGLKLNLLSIIVTIFIANYLFRPDSIQSPSPIITTSYGKLVGVSSVSRDGQVFYSYRGIPYAKPPIGALRYEPPLEPEPWVDTLQASQFGSECPQFDAMINSYSGAEDCLFLNVYVPKAVAEGNKVAPVMVYIHGGIFMFGSANMYGPDYFMDHENIILVSINYRVSSLGFLNTGDGVVRGNMGLKDQTLALKWVQKNIKYFNGDPNQVTIFGESAGGSSVHFQVVSPLTKGLFHRAIVMSGSTLSPWSVKPNPGVQAERHAARVNCTRPTTQEMVQCLKSVPVEIIVKSHDEYLKDKLMDAKLTIFGPTVEDFIKDDKTSFLPVHPLEVLKSGNFNKIPIIIGYNSHEGLVSAPTIINNDTVLNIFNNNFNQMMPNFIFYPPRPQKIINQEMEEIRTFYFGGANAKIDSPDQFLNYVNLFTDWVWAIGAQQSLRFHAEANSGTALPVYAYHYSYKGEFSLAKYLLALKGNFHPIIQIGIYTLGELIDEYVFGIQPIHHGACHGDELALLFKIPRMSDMKAGHRDYEVSKDLVKLWISFAKGDTTLTFRNQLWPKIDAGNTKSLQFLQIDEIASIVRDPNRERIEFLSQYHPK